MTFQLQSVRQTAINQKSEAFTSKAFLSTQFAVNIAILFDDNYTKTLIETIKSNEKNSFYRFLMCSLKLCAKYIHINAFRSVLSLKLCKRESNALRMALKCFVKWTGISLNIYIIAIFRLYLSQPKKARNELKIMAEKRGTECH